MSAEVLVFFCFFLKKSTKAVEEASDSTKREGNETKVQNENEDNEGMQFCKI